MGKNILVFTGLAMAFMMGCSTAKRTSPDRIALYSDSLTMALDQFANNSLIPGFSVSIVSEKGVLYSKGFGFANVSEHAPFTPLTVNWVASVSKTFVALSILKLVEEQKISLDDPINSMLPYPIHNPCYPGIPITVRHLITHTSTIIDDAFVPYYIGEADICIVNDSKKYDSLPDYLLPNLAYYRMGKKISLDEHIRKYTQPGANWYTDSTFLKRVPGTFFQYSNLGAAIAARIVEIKSGMAFRDYTRKYIFEPLHMNHTGWDFEDLNPAMVSKIYAHNDETSPSGVVEHPQYYMTNYPVSGLKTNAIDLGSYLVEMIRGFEGKGKLLRKESWQMLFQPQFEGEGLNKNDSTAFNDRFSIATLWSVSAEGYRMHFGGNTGVYAFLYFNPKTHGGALAISNLRDNSFGEVLTLMHRYEKVMNSK